MRRRIYCVLLWIFIAGSWGQSPILAQESSAYEQATTSENILDVTDASSTQELTSSTELETTSLSTFESTPTTEEQESLQAQLEGIIDADNQFLVKNTTLNPYRKIVRLESFFAAGPLSGSGVLIGPDLVLTAAHNVYNVERSQWVQDVTVTPAQNGDLEPYGVYQASRIFMLKDYQNEVAGTTDSVDMAVIKLSEPVDNQVGFLALSPEIKVGERIQVAGYPVSSDWKIGFLYSMWGEVTTFKGTSLITYYIDTESGQSGSPVLNENNEVIAIHILGFVDKNQNYVYNSARRIMQDSLDMVAFVKGELKSNDAVVSHWLIEKPVYRLYHEGIQRHLYTQDRNEVRVLKTRGWNDEGKSFSSPDYGEPVYRLYSPITKEHLYTTSGYERDILIKRGWKDENTAWYSQGDTPVYRLYHTGLQVHLYTSDTNERSVLIQRGWNDEKIAWYAQ